MKPDLLIDAPPTSHSLVFRMTGSSVAPHDWQRFVIVYGPHILQWCRGYRLQEADARDVAQEVLLRIARQLPKFQYDESRRFRGWIRTIVHRSWCDWVETSSARSWGSGSSSVLAALQKIPARDDLADRFQRQYDAELLQIAVQRVRRRVEPLTWRVFELLAIENLPGVEVSRQTGVKVASAFAVRSRVQRLLRAELDLLGGRPDEQP